MNQTAVEFIKYEMNQMFLTGTLSPIKMKYIIDQALEMEKEQIRDAFNSGMNDSEDYFIPFLEPNDESENYYNKKFKSE